MCVKLLRASLGRLVTPINDSLSTLLTGQRGVAATRVLLERLSHPVRQPGQTLTSSIAPALITCLRWRGFTSECTREGAARHDLLRRHRGSSSTCPAPTIPPVCGLLDHQAVQLQWPTRRRRRQLRTLDTPRSNSTMLSD
eukprot:scaffold121774_cov39-Phaeocystis_antarctica.AAC.1